MSFENPTFNATASNGMPSFDECVAMFKRGEESKSLQMKRILLEAQARAESRSAARQRYLARRENERKAAQKVELKIQSELERTRFEARLRAERKEKQRQARADFLLLRQALNLV